MIGTEREYRAVVIGTSSGGLNALKAILPALPADFGVPIVIVQHIGPSSDSYWISLLDSMCRLHVKEVDEKESIEPGCVYVAPPNYHVLIERNGTLSLSIDERINYARPSIDVLFETAAAVYGNALIGIILTGANNDGTRGMSAIRHSGGLTVAQDPESAEAGYMPAAVIDAMQVDHILPLDEIAELLKRAVGTRPAP
jgi:two-component system chemotaxis response regulator CheB